MSEETLENARRLEAEAQALMDKAQRLRVAAVLGASGAPNGLHWPKLEATLDGGVVATRLHNFEPADWLLRVTPAGMVARRLHQGQVVEAYRFVGPAEAAVWATAISQGFEPPPSLRPCEKLAY